MKFRILTNDELNVLEEDLKAFLIVNGVDGSEWEKINKNSPEKAVALVELFSDMVLEKVYSKLQYLEFRSPKTCMVFNCGTSETRLISLQLDEKSPADLSTPESIHQALLQHANTIQFLKHTRVHQKTREEEIHQLIEQGCVPSVKEFWVSLETVIDNNN